MSTEVQVVESTLPALTSKELLARVQRIHEVQRSVMVKDVDYGIIPGCQKPSLYKSGAEILLQTFEMGALPEQADVQDLGNADEIRYRVIVPIIHVPTGRILGNGVGECSSNEEKYRWRKMVCQQEFDEADPAQRRIVWKHGKNNSVYQAKQVRTNPSDLANTILKMAKKRGLIDGALTVTAASRNFTQDVEDLPREYVEQEPPMRPNIPQIRPQSKPEAADGPQPVVAGEAQQKRDELPPAPNTSAAEYGKRLAQEHAGDVPHFTYGKYKGKSPYDESVPGDYLAWIEPKIAESINDPKRSRYQAENQALLDAVRAAALDRGMMDLPTE